MFTLEQLRYFVTVADELHFGRAASRLAMTQPPLSRQIQKLEHSVGARLLDRDSRGVSLTAAGAAFLVEARRLLALAQAAPDLARRMESGSAGTVRVAFTAAATLAVLPSLLQSLRSALPEVDLDLSELRTGDQVPAMLAGELDLGLARPPFDDSRLGSRPFHREDLVLAVPTRHPLAERGTPVAPSELHDEAAVLYTRGGARYFHDLVEMLLPVATLDVVDAVGQVLTMVSLVSGGRGVAFVPASATRLGLDGVTYLPLSGLPEKPVELHLMWAHETTNPALRRVLATLDREGPETRD